MKSYLELTLGMEKVVCIFPVTRSLCTNNELACTTPPAILFWNAWKTLPSTSQITPNLFNRKETTYHEH